MTAPSIKNFVRLRPMVGVELDQRHPRLELVASDTEITIARKSWKGFHKVFKEGANNQECYDEAVDKLLDFVEAGNTSCLFTYGHTGSGKTHTIFGYENEKGMFHFAAERLERLVFGLEDSHKYSIEVRFAEVYNGNVYDLLDDRICCTVREDGQGKIHIRGDVIRNPDGSWRVKVLKGMHAKTSKEIVDIVNFGLKTRKVGSSGVHDQSSRSHAVLEMEIVTKDLIAARNYVQESHSQAALLGKQYHGLKLKTISLQDTGYESVFRLRKAFDDAEEKHKESLAALANLKKCGPKLVSGTIVFIDLAGSEYAGSIQGIASKSKKEQEEAREINLSLLALKQCIRDLNLKKQRIPFRNSKLTMILKQHLKRSSDGMTGIIVNISPSAIHESKTINALHYAEIIA